MLAGPRERLDPDSLIIVLIGASAVGKSTLARYACDNGIAEATPTWATRQPRQGETDTSYDHLFVTDEEFDLNADDFIEQKTLYGSRYGLPFPHRPPEGVVPLMVLKPDFIPALVKHFPKTRIYHIEASSELTEERMEARGQSREDIDARLSVHDAENETARRVAHVTLNNNGAVEQARIQFEAQVQADLARHGGTDAAMEALPVPAA